MNSGAAAGLEHNPRGLVLSLVRGWQCWYRNYHGLVPVGSLLLLGREQYRGKPRVFPDNTWLLEGDVIGSLHFDNARLAAMASHRDRHGIAWRFSRMLWDSLEELAQASRDQDKDAPKVFRGTTWMSEHGSRVGFVSEPLKDGWRARLLRWQFRLLRSCFAPAIFRTSQDFSPRDFWITRAQLLENFAQAGTTIGSHR